MRATAAQRWIHKPVMVLTGALAVGLGGCKELTGTQSLPAGVQSPSYYNTPGGALGMRNAAYNLFQQALQQYVHDSGLLSDELTIAPFAGTMNGIPVPVIGSLDQRILLSTSENVSSSFSDLQQYRGAASQAIGALGAYAPTAAPALRGELYALQGYAEIMLADLFCSGIPLSALDFNADFTYQPGSTTTQVYEAAITKFDTALALSGDSVRIMNLARVGIGRAQLALGNYAAAAQAVAAVPDGFQYQLLLQWGNLDAQTGLWSNIINSRTNIDTYGSTPVDVADQEGGNGLPFLSSGDPRTADTLSGITTNPPYSTPLHFPKKYLAGLNGYGPFTLADWTEARLIRAEAALAIHDPASWLAELNDLRRNATVVGQTDPLPQLSDPGSDSARVTLLFRERAYWLYLTGHRQGDLRRLVRVYRRDQSTVYPSGDYLPSGQGSYGSDVTVPIPSSEDPNPLFHGCLNHNA